ncbi:hypothetical protein CU311_07665 [Prochlorococcus marinus str. MU1402]|uniref:hypothetical protein n=1 Tax=Prochlorococcus marinus TaxID=1219 RepID=UPI001AD9B2B2|nr:hypothetical protein [Prochlorococcus marinus]MBO8232563.1 hypothetical protein [Prochlorococcus marinus XMU1402]MBW3057282.1 hypothetical protein [Prochlorococcus marinus str. MU1402]
MSYFAKPNFIIYDEWFDNDLEKTKLDIKNKKLKTISNLHEYYYEQSNYKVGASEKHMQLDIKVNEKEVITYDYLEKSAEKYSLESNKKFRFFQKLFESRLKFNISKKLIYSLSIFGFILFFGFLLIFISQSKKNNSTITDNSFYLEKEF